MEGSRFVGDGQYARAVPHGDGEGDDEQGPSLPAPAGSARPVNRVNLLHSIVLLALAVSPALAQDTTHAPWTRQVIASTKLAESRTVYVATPASYSGRTQRYPVLVLL